MTEDELIIEITGLCKSYGSLQVLRNVSLTVTRGEVIVVIGPSGSGKTTLLRCVNRLVDPDSGRIVVSGIEMTARGVDLPRARRNIGLVSQHFNLYPHMSVLGNVLEGPRTVLGMPREAARAMAMGLLDRVGLSDKAQAYPNQLSGGQQQRVAIARALAMNPAVMLFDEPTSALDPELTSEVLDTMKELADDGMTMVIVSHEMHFANRVADRIIMMDGGEVVDEGPPSVMFQGGGSDRTRRFLGRLLSWETG